jgi:hypothetical protein
MVTPASRREAVAHLRVAFAVSERRACSALGTDRTSVRYRSHGDIINRHKGVVVLAEADLGVSELMLDEVVAVEVVGGF